MTILFDLIALQPSQGKFHGAGEHARAVFEQVCSQKKPNITLFAVYIKNVWIDEAVLELAAKYKVTLLTVRDSYQIASLVEKYRIECFYSALPYDYGDHKLDNTHFVMTIHGLRDLEMPSDRYEYKYNKSLIACIKFVVKQVFPEVYRKRIKEKFQKLFEYQNKTILAPSLHTKYSLVSNFNLDPQEINFFYSPDKCTFNAVIDEKDSGLGALLKSVPEYILIIGGNRWIKNSYRALSAIEKFVKKPVDVIIVGESPAHKRFLKNKRFHFIDYVESSSLEYLYKQSLFLLYPTLNEGFGVPPLEAMKYGVPVIASSISAVSEVYHDAIIYCNPFSEIEIAARINMLLFDQELFKIYKKKSRSFYLKMSKIQKKTLENIAAAILKKKPLIK